MLKQTFSLDPGKDWQAEHGADAPVPEDPLILPVKPVRELADLRS